LGPYNCSVSSCVVAAFSDDADGVLCHACCTSLPTLGCLKALGICCDAVVEDHDASITTNNGVCVGMLPTRPVYNAALINSTCASQFVPVGPCPVRPDAVGTSLQEV
jgi:hypothetical protein